MNITIPQIAGGVMMAGWQQTSTIAPWRFLYSCPAAEHYYKVFASSTAGHLSLGLMGSPGPRLDPGPE